MEKAPLKNPHTTTIILIMILIVISLIFIAQEYGHIRQVDYKDIHQSLLESMHGRQPATIDDVPSIQAWMTFDYIDRLFGLPPQYLQTNLSITEANFPHMTITQYGKDKGETQAVALEEVQNSIKTYLLHPTQ